MATLNVVNMKGETVGQIELSDVVFNAPVREHLLWEVVVAQLAGRRRGTAATKGRSDVRGSTRKLFKQKGTGRARHGASRAAIFVGGGSMHGPHPRSYAQRTPKKVRRGALISALSLRAQEQKLIVVDKLEFGEIKTKHAAQLMNMLGVRSGLVVESKDNLVFAKSMRNLPRVKQIAPEGVNVYDVLRYETLVVTRETVKQLEERLAP